MVELIALDEGTWELEVEALRGGVYVTLLGPPTDNDRKCFLLRLDGGETVAAIVREYYGPVALQELRDGERPEKVLVNIRRSLDQLRTR